MVEAPKTPVRSICGREALGFSTEKVHGRHNFGGRSVKRMDSCVVCQIARHHSFRGPLRFQLISLDVRTPGVFNILTSKYGFAPQRRALFRHLNFQKWFEHGMFCAFSLRNVLRATTAYTFSSLIWPAGSAPAAFASLLFDPPEPQIIGKTQ